MCSYSEFDSTLKSISFARDEDDPNVDDATLEQFEIAVLHVSIAGEICNGAKYL